MRGCFHRPCRYVGPNLSRCTRCRVAWYCGPFCQKTDWPRHRAFCGHGKPADAEPHHRFNRPVGYGVDEIADQLGEFGIHDVSPWSLLRENPRRTQYRSMGEDVEDDGVVEGLEDLVGEPVSDSDDYREEGEEHLQLEDLAGGAD
ncbi:hypothetical protein DFJ74DRAFT_695127 [Hyaloraphidium curvatum]|nr:hypothetical protein DFJ74DRAFT_695127 [Hyaloraphidium curvatum]